jgi:release factor glutamine methyltransferase
MKIRVILQEAASALGAAGSSAARLEAEVILAHLLKTDRAGLFRATEGELGHKEAQAFGALVARRAEGEPVAYLLGEKEFWSLDFFVDDRVLIPRPETEVLVEEVLALCGSRGDSCLRILEIGTGSGAVSVALATELPSARFWATDISAQALVVAKHNAERHAVAERITFLPGDLFAPVSGRFHVIVSNPPYIPEDEFDALPCDVKKYEPPIALVAGEHGLRVQREMIREGHRFLEEGGWMFLEVGCGQAPAIEKLLEADGHYRQIAFREDYGGEKRIARAVKKRILESGERWIRSS